jgi:hypothetical protein
MIPVSDLPWLVLALGMALVVGNVLAIVRPPAKRRDGDLARAPMGRSVSMALLGLICAIWAFATIIH